jgi:DNA polymerase-3 subunit beta
MHLRLDGSSLAEAVAWTARGLPARPAVPVLAGLLLEAGADGQLRLSSFDYEVGTRSETPCEVESPGRALVPGRLLADFSKALRGGEVELLVSGGELEVSGGGTRFALAVLPADEYPALPQPAEPSGTVDGAALAAAVAQTVVAAGREETLPALTGIRIEAAGGMLTLAATDRYRFAVRTLPWQPADPELHAVALVPARTLAEAAKSLAGSRAELSFGSETGDGAGGLFAVSTAHRRTTTRLLEGALPKFDKLFPEAPASIARVGTARLLESVKRVALAADPDTPVRLAFTAEEVALSVETHSGARAHERIAAELDGPEIVMACTPGWLADGLAAIDASVTRISMDTPTRPVVLCGMRGEEGDGADGGADGVLEADASYRYLMSPRRG